MLVQLESGQGKDSAGASANLSADGLSRPRSRMSIQALAWVLEHSEATKGPRCVLIAIANHADESGENCWASVATLAHEAKLSERATRYALRTLEEEEEIEQTGSTHRGTHIYRIPGVGRAKSAGGASRADQGGKNVQGGGQESLGGGQPTAPEPSGEPSGEPSTEPGAASAAFRLCCFLSEIAGEEPKPVYGESQIRGAEWLLENVDHQELAAAARWGISRPYWAPRVRTAGKLRRAWADLRVEYRAASSRNGQARGSVGASPDDLRQKAAELRSRGL